MKRIAFFYFICMLCACISTSCSPDESEGLSESSITGRWIVTHTTESQPQYSSVQYNAGGTMTVDQLAEIGKTGIFVAKQSGRGTWSIEGNSIKMQGILASFDFGYAPLKISSSSNNRINGSVWKEADCILERYNFSPEGIIGLWQIVEATGTCTILETGEIETIESPNQFWYSHFAFMPDKLKGETKFNGIRYSAGRSNDLPYIDNEFAKFYYTFDGKKIHITNKTDNISVLDGAEVYSVTQNSFKATWIGSDSRHAFDVVFTFERVPYYEIY